MSDEIDVIEEADASQDEGTPFKALLNEEEEKKLKSFLSSELTLAMTERQGEEEEWADIRRERIARPKFKHKDTPWPNASNVSVPGMMIAQNTIYGVTKNSFGSKKPFWAIEAMQSNNHEDLEIARVIEKHMQRLADSEQDLNKREKDREIQEETDLLGTCWVMVPWTTETQRIAVASPEGTTTQVEVTLHDGPEWVVIPREDVYHRVRERNVQKARWWAHRIELEEADVEERFATNKWTEFENWKRFSRTESRDHERALDEEAGSSSQPRVVYDFYEVYIKWDIEPKDGIYEDLLLVYSQDANMLVKVDLNPMGMRMVRAVNFIKRAFRMDGFGVGQAALHMQEELNTIHNQRNDSVHQAGLRMYLARRNCGIKAREKLSPGRIIFVDNIKEDFAPMQSGEVYPSSLQAEGMAWSYLEKATLMSATMSGFADATMKSRDSIGLNTQRMKASSGIIGSILESMEDDYSNLGLMTFYQLVFNKERVIENETKIKRLSENDLALLKKALDIPLEEVPIRLRFSVRTADAEQTYEVRRQNTMTLFSIYSMFQKTVLPLYMQMFMPNPQTGQPMLPPPVQEFVMRLITGNSRLMEKIFDFFEEDDTDRYVPDYKKMEMLLDMKHMMEEQVLQQAGGFNGLVQKGAGGAGVLQGAAAGGGGNAGQQRMEGGFESGGGAFTPGGSSGVAGGRGVQALPSAGLAGGLA